MRGYLQQAPEGLCQAAPCIRPIMRKAGVLQRLQRGKGQILQQQQQLRMLHRVVMPILVHMEAGVAEELQHMRMVAIRAIIRVVLGLEQLVVAMVIMAQQGVMLRFQRVQEGGAIPGLMPLHTQPSTDQLGQHNGGDCRKCSVFFCCLICNIGRHGSRRMAALTVEVRFVPFIQSRGVLHHRSVDSFCGAACGATHDSEKLCVQL